MHIPGGCMGVRREDREPRLPLLSTVAPPLPEEPNDLSEYAESGLDVPSMEPAATFHEN